MVIIGELMAESIYRSEKNNNFNIFKEKIFEA